MRITRLTLLVIAVLSLWTVTEAADAQARRPNILLIYADDQSYKTVGCYPESWPWVRTPNIDALAKTGVRFQGAYLGSWCMPSRATLLTGRHPHGIESMRMEGTYPGSTYDPKQTPFWPSVFRKQGYHTAPTSRKFCAMNRATRSTTTSRGTSLCITARRNSFATSPRMSIRRKNCTTSPPTPKN